MASFERLYYRSERGLLTRAWRNLRLLVALAAAVLAWLTSAGDCAANTAAPNARVAPSISKTISASRAREERLPGGALCVPFSHPPLSGNTINGLGEAGHRRAQPIFHGSGMRTLEWGALESFFALTMPFRLYWQGIVNRWWLRKAAGPVARRQTPGDPAARAREIKSKALELGAGVVGVCRIRDDALFEGYETTFTHAVVIAMPMAHEEMRHVPELRSANEVMRVYFEISRRRHQACGIHPLARIRRPGVRRECGHPAHPAGHRRRHRGTRQTRIVDHAGFRLQCAPGYRADRAAARCRWAGRHSRRRSVPGLPALHDRLPGRRDRRFEATRARDSQMVCGFRPLCAVLFEDFWLWHLHRGVSMDETGPGSIALPETAGEASEAKRAPER